MDSETSDNVEEASGKNIFEKENTKNIEARSVKIDIPPAISPINSPVKPNETPTEEVRVQICAPDQPTAENVAKSQLPQSRYMGPIKTSKLHFFFSAQFTPQEILQMKKDLKKLIKLPKNIQIVNFYVFNEDKVYDPEEKHNCPG